MLAQARDQLGEVAGAVADVELEAQDLVPAVATGARRAGQAEDVGAAGDGGVGARLQRGGADLLVAEHAEQLAEAGDVLVRDRARASGVTSRPVTPVPPVVITTSTAGSAIHWRSWAAIASRSSRTMARAASSWPAAAMRSASVSPERSSAAVRVSETVSTAIRKGWNGTGLVNSPGHRTDAFGRLALGFGRGAGSTSGQRFSASACSDGLVLAGRAW